MAYTAIPTSGHQDSIIVVGHINSFPRHPEPGAQVEPFPNEVPPTGPSDRLYALVSVQWAQQWTSVDIDTGESSTEYRAGGTLGTPTGTTWYLAPVVIDGNTYRLTGRVARGFRDAQLPEIPGLDAPMVVPIHDHQL
ncbi:MULTISPECIES: hypothetical protein [Mycolicibacter]|uniref:Lipoprotein LpqN n=2 Tax=Mycolicibacter TaxID=1073531 RepID=A0ABU5XLA0_9MYCO|nr:MULTISPECIES: hypothetical protein [unclassified Mycolicibacter]MEB3023063.1 hypothetical protein [Mycolicibacter sp. MYC098]MEB3033573.1 hypothetical protein [Mycolicibacter sp. MYC340]